MYHNLLICKDFDNAVRWVDNERLDHMFERRCDELPADHLAVVTADVSLTFRELDRRANQTARYLLDQGLRAGDRVGLLFDKSIHGYVALLAVLKIGAAYVPLDAGFPPDRIAFILKDAEVRAIASVERYRAKLAEFDIQQLFLDSVAAEVEQRPVDRLSSHEKPASSDQLFYVIYTSGTTGKPKGVAIEHSGICNFVKVAGEVYGIREGDRCYQGMTLAFDFHVEDLWVPLIAGATLIAGKSGRSLFGGDLHAFLLKQRVTVFPCVPTLLATVEEDLPDVRILLLSGEAVPHNLVLRWHRPGRSILNAYGPTECSVSSTLRRLEPESPVTIGVPLPTYTVVILDEHKDAEVPDGAVGEIGIAGIGLALGYLNREDLTKQKFIHDFLNLPNNPSRRIYRTGDFGRIREDGELEFLGRIDTQVKIRGYRVELGEIEAVLLQLPHIAQAVVQPQELEPGAIELVAYYTHKQGAPEVPEAEIVDTLRRQLPGYMVPAYLEELDVIPMTSNNKADRKNLPLPKSGRLSASAGKFVAPRTATEEVLAAALGEVMTIDRVSVEDDFFQDLGGHSLLMARFGAEIRKRLNISAVSMQDIYLNPTIEKLARHIDSLPTDAADQPGVGEQDRIPVRIPSSFAYYACGALQLAWITAWTFAGAWVFVASIKWTYSAMPNFGELYLRVMMLALGLTALASFLPVAAKWLLIGRWKPQVIPIWGLRYFRFWAVKGLVSASPLAVIGDPYYNFYLRLLGAKIGANTVIHAGSMPVCTDLLTIGSDTVIRKNSRIHGYQARANYLHIGPVSIGSNAYVGESSLVDINTTMEDDTQLAHASCLLEGQRIPRGKRYHGTPARETTTNFHTVGPAQCSLRRRLLYPLVVLLPGLLFMPVPVFILYWLYPHFYALIGGTTFDYVSPMWDILGMVGWMAPLTLALFLFFMLRGFIAVGAVPRLLNLLLEPGRTYVLYGFHYFLQQWIARATNSAFFNRVFGDSSAITFYARWMGYNLNEIVQTGSNFGEEQAHDNPHLCDIGSGTMVSDGLMMSNAEISSSSFTLGKVKIGRNNYLGNYVHYPSGGMTGDNCLLGTMVMVPVDGPVRENVGLLGSPCFEIPRAVSRDRRMADEMDEATRLQRLKEKNRYNLMTAIYYLAKTWFLYFVIMTSALFSLVYYQQYGLSAVIVAGYFSFAFAVLWGWFIERLNMGFGWLSPQTCLVLDRYYWFHERHWHLFGLVALSNAFAGTPMKNLFSRLQGVRLGKKVFDDGVVWTEYSLIEVGDHANLNQQTALWPHSLEEAVFKSDRIRIGAGCTIGSGALVHYGVTMGDQAVLDPGSYLMKGEILGPATRWRGNPAKAVVEKAVCDAGQGMPEGSPAVRAA